jgi:hypothetical protein
MEETTMPDTFDSTDTMATMMDEPDEFDSSAAGSELIRDPVMEWFITPEQFVDFWIAVIFLLVGTWQIISILFLITD